MHTVMAAGTIVATGAEVTIPLGFQPDRVEIVNITDGNSVDLWLSGMAEGTSVTMGAGGATKRAANGVSLHSGGTTSFGFKIGSGIALAGKTLAYNASRAV